MSRFLARERRLGSKAPAGIADEAHISRRLAAALLPPLLLLAAAPAAAGPAAAPDGKALYTQYCAKCHDPSLGAFFSGAPRLGSDAWKPRLRQAGSVDALVASAVKGKGDMPPRGGPNHLSDAELKAAIAYILGESGL